MRNFIVVGLLLLGVACFRSEPARDNPVLADVPLESVLGLPILQLRVGDSDRILTFLIDTGFDVSVLDVTTAGELGLSASDVHAEAQPGGSVETGKLAARSLHIGRLEVADVELATVPVASLAMMLGRPFHGIIGHDVLTRYVVDIDYSAGRVRFADSTTWEIPADGVAIAVEDRNGEPLVDAIVGTTDGREVLGRFKLDTGSLDVIGMNLNFVRDNKLLTEADEELPVGGVAVGGGTEGRIYRAASFTLGNRRHDRPLVGYTVDSSGFEERADAGTIGVQVLARSRLVLDYPHDRIWLVDPESPPMAEDRSGMLLVSPAPEFNELIVAIVAPGSPGAEAQLQPGDRIVSLNGRRDLSLNDARVLLREPGPLDVVYERGGVRTEVTLQRRLLLPR